MDDQEKDCENCLHAYADIEKEPCKSCISLSERIAGIEPKEWRPFWRWQSQETRQLTIYDFEEVTK